jgi:hypothetical protein
MKAITTPWAAVQRLEAPCLDQAAPDVEPDRLEAGATAACALLLGGLSAPTGAGPLRGRSLRGGDGARRSAGAPSPRSQVMAVLDA